MIISGEIVVGISKLDARDRQIYAHLEKICDDIKKKYDCASCADWKGCKEGDKCVKDLAVGRKYEHNRKSRRMVR